MNEICNKDICSGCGACVNICPKSCIILKPDRYGCVYPSVNEAQCINCGMCKKVCIQENKQEKVSPKKTYAAYLKENNERLDSASGGVAKSLYSQWLKQEDAYVVGVSYDENMQAHFSITNNVNDIPKFQGSKYVQAFTTDIYKQVELLLKDNKKILFIGLPCNVAAILNYLKLKKVSLNNILTVDLLCHGVSPHQYLDEQLKYLRDKHKLKSINKLSFRGNRKYRQFHFATNGYNDYAMENPYFYAFLKGISLRESCYNCQFANKDRISDITIGDFIGLAGEIPFEGIKENASLILANTEKGSEFISELSDLNVFERTFEEAYRGGSSLQGPFPRHNLREKFLKHYQKGNFVKTIYRIAFKEIYIYALKVLPKKLWVYWFMKNLLK